MKVLFDQSVVILAMQSIEEEVAVYYISHQSIAYKFARPRRIQNSGEGHKRCCGLCRKTGFGSSHQDRIAIYW